MTAIRTAAAAYTTRVNQAPNEVGTHPGSSTMGLWVESVLPEVMEDLELAWHYEGIRRVHRVQPVETVEDWSVKLVLSELDFAPRILYERKASTANDFIILADRDPAQDTGEVAAEDYYGIFVGPPPERQVLASWSIDIPAQGLPRREPIIRFTPIDEEDEEG